MTKRDVALAYVQAFCAGDLDRLETLFTPDLKFEGTFHTYRSRAAYMESLRSDPPERAGFDVRSVTEDEESVAIFYAYQKPDRTLTLAQLFKVKDRRICEVLLVFDGRGFD